MRIKNKGVKVLNREIYGDLLVTIKAEVPNNLDKETKAITTPFILQLNKHMISCVIFIKNYNIKFSSGLILCLLTTHIIIIQIIEKSIKYKTFGKHIEN